MVDLGRKIYWKFRRDIPRAIARIVKAPRAAWRGAAWGALIVGLIAWVIFAWYALAPAGATPFVVGTLAPVVIMSGLVALALAVGWLARGIPVFYRWVVLTVLPLLILVYMAPAMLYGVIVVVLGLLVCASLAGAGIAVVSGRGWRSLDWGRRLVAAGGLVLGMAGLIAGGAWLLSDGAGQERPINAAAISGERVQALMLPDPAEMGPFEVLTLTYGSGTDRHRAVYGADVDLQTQAVDGGAFLTGWSELRTRYWGFGPEALPRNGRVWYPNGEGPFPLVLIVHGNHLMEDYSDAGYAYLGELLASRGMIVASVDQNFLNMSLWSDMLVVSPLENENNARAWLLLEHVQQWLDWHEGTANPFVGKVDLESIALVGHSRGGEAVATAAAFSSLAYHPDDASLVLDYPFTIRAVVAIAPVDGQYRPGSRGLQLNNVNYLTLHGSHDMDVVSFQGLRQYGRIQFDGKTEAFKAALYIDGANHGQFNRDWGTYDLIGPANQLFNVRPLLPVADQERIAQVTISAFLEAALNGEDGYRQLFRDPRSGAEWLPQTVYLSQYQDSETVRLATFEEDIDLTSMTLDGGRIEGVGLTRWHEKIVGMRRETLGHSAVTLGWDVRTDTGEAAHYALLLPETVQGLNEQMALTFGLAASNADPNPHAEDAPAYEGIEEPVDLTVEVVDGNGERARLPLSAFSLVQPPLAAPLAKASFMSFVAASEPIFQTFTLPLHVFAATNEAFDSESLREIRFIFDRTQAGVLLLDEVGLQP